MIRFILLISYLALCTAQYYYSPQVNVPVNVANQQQSQQQYHTIETNQQQQIKYNSNNLPKLVQPVRDEYNKEFYTYTAPSQSYDDQQIDRYISNILKKNLRVIFIKNTEQNAFERAALKLAQSNLADRTAIYVLNRQPDLKNLINQLHRSKDQHKPEVHFVNYQTPKDAEHAEHSIQSKYEHVPGTTTFYSSTGQKQTYGSGSSTAVTGIGPHATADVGESLIGGGGGQEVYTGLPANTYLPPAKH